MPIKCTSNYRSGPLAYKKGDIIDDPALERFLLVDSPGSFKPVEKRVSKPPVDRAVQRAPVEK